MEHSDLTVLWTVQCDGENHRLGIDNRGRFIAFDHGATELNLEDHLRREAGLRPAHRCARYYREWKGMCKRGRTSYGEDPILVQALQQSVVERKSQRSKWAQLVDPLTTNINTRHEQLIKPVAKEALARSSYRTGERKHGRHDLVIRFTKHHPDIACEVDRQWSGSESSTIPNTTLRVWLKPTWYYRVYKRGWALLGGRFVLDVIGQRKNGLYILTVGHQSRGYSVVPRGALWDDRKCKMRWL